MWHHKKIDAATKQGIAQMKLDGCRVTHKYFSLLNFYQVKTEQ